MTTKNKTFFILSASFFIAVFFITASMIFLRDKKSAGDIQEESATANVEKAENNSKKNGTEKKEEAKKELSPQEFVNEGVQVIIDDLKQQDISFETEITYFSY